MIGEVQFIEDPTITFQLKVTSYNLNKMNHVLKNHSQQD